MYDAVLAKCVTGQMEDDDDGGSGGGGDGIGRPSVERLSHFERVMGTYLLIKT